MDNLDDYVFPRVTPLGERPPGMEIIDWFAGLAMHARLTHPDACFEHQWADTAMWAYEVAFEMNRIRKGGSV